MNRICIIFLMSALLSCSEGFRTRDHGTRLNSKDYPNKEERLAVFSKVLRTHSAIKDVEFDLFNVNGFGDTRSIPGASSIHYRYVVKVDPADVNLWTDFLQPISPDTFFAWQDSLVSSRKEQWICRSNPQYFVQKGNFGKAGGFVLIAFRPEGIVFRDVIQN